MRWGRDRERERDRGRRKIISYFIPTCTYRTCIIQTRHFNIITHDSCARVILELHEEIEYSVKVWNTDFYFYSQRKILRLHLLDFFTLERFCTQNSNRSVALWMFTFPLVIAMSTWLFIRPPATSWIPFAWEISKNDLLMLHPKSCFA